MEGAARLLNAYNKSKCSLCCTACCCFNKTSKQAYKKKLFHGDWLKVDEAVDPSLINWENLGLSRKARCVRITCLSFVAIILLVATTLAILYAKVKESEMKQDNITCSADSDITQEMALIDSQRPEEDQ